MSPRLSVFAWRLAGPDVSAWDEVRALTHASAAEAAAALIARAFAIPPRGSSMTIELKLLSDERPSVMRRTMPIASSLTRWTIGGGTAGLILSAVEHTAPESMALENASTTDRDMAGRAGPRYALAYADGQYLVFEPNTAFETVRRERDVSDAGEEIGAPRTRIVQVHVTEMLGIVEPAEAAHA